MSVPPAMPDKVAFLARCAALELSPEHLTELADAYAHVEPMLARIRRHRPHADEPAHIFDPLLFASRAEEER